GGGERKIDLGGGIDFAAEGDLTPGGRGPLVHGSEGVMPFPPPNLRGLQIDALCRFAGPQSGPGAVVVGFGFKASGLVVSEAVAKRLRADAENLVAHQRR